MKTILLILALVLGLSACSSVNKTQPTDADWHCSNGNLDEYEQRDRDGYLKIKCRLE